jgi:hypothetical protein
VVITWHGFSSFDIEYMYKMMWDSVVYEFAHVSEVVGTF